MLFCLRSISSKKINKKIKPIELHLNHQYLYILVEICIVICIIDNEAKTRKNTIYDDLIMGNQLMRKGDLIIVFFNNNYFTMIFSCYFYIYCSNVQNQFYYVNIYTYSSFKKYYKKILQSTLLICNIFNTICK